MGEKMKEQIKQKIIENHFDNKNRFMGRKKFDYLSQEEKNFFESLFTIKNLTLKEKIFLFLKDFDENEILCKCGNKRKIINFNDGLTQYCNMKCPIRQKENAEKVKNTLFEKYGVENAAHLPQTKENHWSKIGKKEQVSKKISKIKKEKSPEHKKQIYEKYKQTTLEKYGVENYFQKSDEIKQAMKEKYGVTNSMHIKEVFEKAQKNGFKVKEVKFGNKVYKVRGYEHFAFNYFSKDDIIEQNFKIEMGEKVYFADFKIGSKIIEIKSDFTLKQNLSLNIKKMNYSKKKYEFEFWVFDEKGNRTILKNEKEVLFFLLGRNYFSRYDLTFFDKKELNIFINFIKRNFKPKFNFDILVEKNIKKNIPFYELEEVLNLIYNKMLSYKTGKVDIYEIFYKFIKSFKNWKLNKKERIIVEETPKPKYQRNKWKRYFFLKEEIKRLKKAKRKIKKKYTGKILQEKLLNINEEIENKQKRLLGLTEKLK